MMPVCGVCRGERRVLGDGACRRQWTIVTVSRASLQLDVAGETRFTPRFGCATFGFLAYLESGNHLFYFRYFGCIQELNLRYPCSIRFHRY